MKIATKRLTWLDRHGKGLFWSFACLILFLSSYYVYLMNTMAQNGVRWREAERGVSSSGGRVSELESEYLSLKQSVTLSFAYARGFEDVKIVRFISSRKIGAVSTMHEI